MRLFPDGDETPPLRKDFRLLAHTSLGPAPDVIPRLSVVEAISQWTSRQQTTSNKFEKTFSRDNNDNIKLLWLLLFWLTYT